MSYILFHFNLPRRLLHYHHFSAFDEQAFLHLKIWRYFSQVYSTKFRALKEHADLEKSFLDPKVNMSMHITLFRECCNLARIIHIHNVVRPFKVALPSARLKPRTTYPIHILHCKCSQYE